MAYQDLSEDEQWGNIELPGVPDEVLYNTNWNMVAAAIERWGDPAERAKKSAAMKAHWTDPEARAKKSAALKEAQNRPEVRAKKSDAMKAHCADPEVRAKRSAAMKAHCADPEVRAKRSTAAKGKNTKPIQTPDGIFHSQKAAAEHYGIAAAGLYDRMKRHPDLYYYINNPVGQ